MKEDLHIIAKVAESARTGLPIAEKVGKPGLEAVVFYSDAAGASFSMIRGQLCYHNNVGKGVSCIMEEKTWKTYGDGVG